MKTPNKANWQIIVLPILLFIALVNYHYYNFFQNEFRAVFAYLNIKPSLTTNNYHHIQQFHPFEDLYIQINQFKDKPIYYLYTRYNSKDKLAIDELFIRTVYFAYPRKIQPIHRIQVFLKTEIQSNSLIISDYDLRKTTLVNRLVRIDNQDSKSLPPNYFFRKEKPYYLYQTL